MPIVPGGPVLWGIDVSSYQAGIDLSRMPSVSFVVVKATEGRGYESPTLAAQALGAQGAGMALGLYHFVSSGNTPRQELDNYLRATTPFADFIPVLDYEPADRSRTGWAAEWLDLAESELGVRPWIYMDQSTSLREWPGVKGRTPLWLARYPARPSTVLGQLPDDGWSAPGWNVVCWQYTASGQVPGWGGVLDLDVFYGDRAAWESHCVRRSSGGTHTDWPPVVTTPPDADPVPIYGRLGCGCIRDSLPGIEAALRAVGGVRQDLSGLVTQGAYNRGVTASAGTHDGGGVWDVAWSTVDTPDKLRAWRSRGVAMWPRTPAQGFPYHGHGVWMGCPHLAAGAARQVNAYRMGLDGLAAQGPDPGPRVPPITWQDAITADRPAPTALQEGDMIHITSPGRGSALIGPGFIRPLTTPEEVEQGQAIASRVLTGNDRQYDLWVSMAYVAPAPVATVQGLDPAVVKDAIAAALADLRIVSGGAS